MNKIKSYLSLVKFSHSIFAMPFAIIGFFLCLVAYPDLQFQFRTFLLIVLCMIFARNAAMAFNRYVDRVFDAQNPRTQNREIPAGVIPPTQARWFIIINSVGFVVVTWLINPLCFYLSPVALFVILFYSYSKRFTYLCHYILGLGLGLVPIGAYLAAGGLFDMIPILLGISVMFWVAGFDIVYALQDAQLDRRLNLKSVPSHFGLSKALIISRSSHFVSAMLLILAAYNINLSYNDIFDWPLIIGTLLFIGFLIYQQSLVSADDLSRVNLSFFTMNGLASVLFGILFILDIYVF